MVDHYRNQNTEKWSKRFPGIRRSIPFSLAKAHEAQMRRNHSQTADELNGRGGLCPIELWAVLNDADYPWNQPVDEAAILEDIERIVSDWEKRG